MKKLENTLRQKANGNDPKGSGGVICVSIREGAPSLLITTLNGRRWFLPWIHLIYAYHEPQSESEQIILDYVSHEVTIEGKRLKRLIEQLSKFGVEWIKAYDRSYFKQCPKDSPYIEKIVVSDKGENLT